VRRFFAALCLCLALCAAAVRAEISAKANITATEVGTGEPFQINVQVVTDDKAGNLPWPEVQGLEKFSVTKNSSTSQSSSTTIINGRVSQRNLYITTFTYSLTAKTPGNFVVGPIRYAYKEYEQVLGSANVTVSKQEAALTAVPSINKREAYLGEQVLYNFRVTHTAAVQNVESPQQAIQKNIGEKCWLQFLDKSVPGKEIKSNGQMVRVYDIRVALFPLLNGKLDLGGASIDYQQASQARRRRTGSVFDMFDDDFFGGANAVQMTATASPVSMEVLPLPPGAPQGFTGSVGEYSLTAAADKTTVASGDAITLTVTIRGDGLPKSVTSPKLPDLGDFEVFDPEIATASAPQGATLMTTKTFKYVIVPRRKGEFTLGPVAFPYFDPRKKAYVEAKSAPIAVSVTEGKEIVSSPARGAPSQREIADIGSDIRHIKTDMAVLTNENDFLYKHGWFWMLFPPTPAALALLLVLRRRSQRLESDATLKRKTQASAHLRKRLKEASEALKQKNSREFYKALSQAVVGFASDKLNVEFRGLTMDEAKAKLRGAGLSEPAVEEYEKVLQQCDFGQFAGGVRDEKAWKEALGEAEDLLRRLEKET
jgi:hypothetical protein